MLLGEDLGLGKSVLEQVVLLYHLGIHAQAASNDTSEAFQSVAALI